MSWAEVDVIRKILYGDNGATVISKAVKSVQSGRVTANGTTSNKYITDFASGGGSSEKNTYYLDITISAVANINKCQVKVDNLEYNGNVPYSYVGWLTSTSNLRVAFKSDSANSTVSLNKPFRWEVTEFY